MVVNGARVIGTRTKGMLSPKVGDLVTEPEYQQVYERSQISTGDNPPQSCCSTNKLSRYPGTGSIKGQKICNTDTRK